jgi:hypothetical protein
MVLMLAGMPPGVPAAPQLIVSDRVPHPPVRREQRSPTGAFVLVISTLDEWKSPQATGELFSVTGSTRRSIWRRQLPQQLGPRFEVVSDGGDVLLLDEWVVVMSRYAVMLLSPSGLVRQWSFDDVRNAMGVDLARIVTNDRIGLWIARPARVEPGAAQVAVPTVAGKSLLVSFADGRLSVGS